MHSPFFPKETSTHPVKNQATIAVQDVGCASGLPLMQVPVDRNAKWALTRSMAKTGPRRCPCPFFIWLSPTRCQCRLYRAVPVPVMAMLGLANVTTPAPTTTTEAPPLSDGADAGGCSVDGRSYPDGAQVRVWEVHRQIQRCLVKETHLEK